MKLDLPFEMPEPGTFAAACFNAAEDECLLTLALLTHAYRSRNPKALQLAADLVRPHVDECRNPDCFERVRATACNTDDPMKKRCYKEIADRFAMEWVRVDGEYRITDSPAGRTFFIRWGPEFVTKVPFSAMEVFHPASGDAGHVILDARSEDTFRDPRPILQSLDASTTSSIQTYETLAPSLTWLHMLGDYPYRLFVRWNGRLKKLADDASFYSRYKPLLHSSRACETDPDVMIQAKDPDLGEEVLTLREEALKYDPQQAWFSGFLKTALEFRRIDDYRHGKIDLLAHADRIEDGNPRKREMAEPETSLDELGFTDVPDELDSGEDLDRSRLMARLWTLLSDIERKVLDLKLQDRTDKQIASVLGLDRSTVTKIRARIRLKGGALRN